MFLVAFFRAICVYTPLVISSILCPIIFLGVISSAFALCINVANVYLVSCGRCSVPNKANVWHTFFISCKVYLIRIRQFVENMLVSNYGGRGASFRAKGEKRVAPVTLNSQRDNLINTNNRI